jgi:AcrR family transcriptional regulator
MGSASEETVVIGRRERKKNDTRQALIAAATRLFAHKGIYTTNLEEITVAADLGKGTFYKHFESRDAIIAAVLHEGFTRLMEPLRNEDVRSEDLPTAVRNIIRTHTAFFSEQPEYLLLFHQARGWLKLAAQEKNPVRDEFRAYVRTLAELVATTSRGRGMAPADCDRTARVIAGTISGAFSYEVIVGAGNLVALDLGTQLAGLGLVP